MQERLSFVIQLFFVIFLVGGDNLLRAWGKGSEKYATILQGPIIHVQKQTLCYDVEGRRRSLSVCFEDYDVSTLPSRRLSISYHHWRINILKRLA